MDRTGLSRASICAALLLALALRAQGAPGEVPATSPATAPVDRGVAASLAKIESHYAGVLPWLADVYDPASGGFFESPELKRRAADAPERYGPDIQSTSMALAWLDQEGLLAELPEAARAKLIHFFQSRQDASTGFFADPHYPTMRDDPRVTGRALGFATGALRQLGAEPLHPLPGRRAGAMPEHVRSDDAFAAWLDGRPWDNAWTALDHLQAQTSLLKSLPDARRDALVTLAWEHVRDRQDPATGFAGGGNIVTRISGAAKFGWFCNAFNRPIPRADELARSTVAWYRTNPSVKSATLVRNPIHHLADLQPHLPNRTGAEDRALVLAQTARLIERFHQADGGFAMFVDAFHLAPNDVRLETIDTPQSDMNGTAMARNVRLQAYRLTGVRPPALPGRERLLRALAR